MSTHSPATQQPYQFLIIGAGPAGLAAARTAAEGGFRVALIEAHLLGGLAMNYGSVPSQALIRTSRLYAEMRDAELYGASAPTPVDVDFGLAMARMRRIRTRTCQVDSADRIAGAGIDLFVGKAHFTGKDTVDVGGTQLRFEKALIATGSRSLLPRIPGLDEAGFLTNETVFDLATLPESLLVIGGGPVGCELAQAFSRFGARTIIVHAEPLFLPMEERDAAQLLTQALAHDGVEIHLNTRVVNVRANGTKKIVETVNDGNVATIEVDEILTGIGRLPAILGLNLEAAGVAYRPDSGIEVNDFLCTTNPRIFAAGDACLKQRFIDAAEASALIATHNALHRGRARLSSLIIPWCTYTDPEIAHVGIYVREARERGIPVKTFTVPMHDVVRAIVDGEENGFVKIHVREGTDTILGATVVARHAGEMINGLSLAMVAGIGLTTMASVIHAYPTQAQAIKKAAQAYVKSHKPRWYEAVFRRWFER